MTTPKAEVLLALMLAQGAGTLFQALPVRYKYYGNSGVASAFVTERVLNEYDEVLSSIRVPEVMDDGEYTGTLEGLDELLPGPGLVLTLEDEGSPEVICSNCHNALYGTCSVCAPVKADVRVRRIPGYNFLVKIEKDGKSPEQFAVA